MMKSLSKLGLPAHHRQTEMDNEKSQDEDAESMKERRLLTATEDEITRSLQPGGSNDRLGNSPTSLRDILRCSLGRGIGCASGSKVGIRHSGAGLMPSSGCRMRDKCSVLVHWVVMSSKDEPWVCGDTARKSSFNCLLDRQPHHT